MGRIELRKKIIKGSAWTIFSNMSTQLVSFTVTVILARLLAPQDFGVIAIATVFLGIVHLFQDFGLGAAIIQRKDIDDDYLCTSFFASLGFGFLLALIIIIIAPYIAAFYKEAVLKDILLVSSAGFIASPLFSIHNSLLTRRFEFGKIALVNILMQAASGMISITLAFLGYGVWSLVLGKLLGQPLMTPLVWKLTGWRPRPRFAWPLFKDLFAFSSNLLGFNAINYLSRNADNLIVGKYLGALSLGYYSIAYNLMMKPLQLISWSVGKVLFPAFSSIQDDKERTRAVYIKAIRSISLVTFPMMTGLAIAAEEFILTVYGPKWAPAILPLQLLCGVGALQSIGTTSGVILNSQGRTDLTLKAGVFSTSLTVAAFLIGIRWGLIGLIAAYMAASVPAFLVSQTIAGKAIGLTLKNFTKALGPAAASSAIMVIALLSFRHLNASTLRLGQPSSLAMLIIIGMCSYGFCALKVFPTTEAAEGLAMVRRRFRG